MVHDDPPPAALDVPDDPDDEPVGPDGSPALTNIDLPAPEAPWWLQKVTLLLLLIGGSNPIFGILIGFEMGELLDVPTWLAGMMAFAVLTVPTAAAMVLLLHRRLQHRSACIDHRGIAFGVTPKWRGTLTSWERIESYRLTGTGLMLTIQGQPWTQFLGPVIRTSERLTHDVVVRLEREGIHQID